MAELGNWILKIISGPHQGAEVVLRPGRTVAGTDADCDVVLHDVLIAPRHLALSLEAGRLQLEPLDGHAFVNGRRATQATPVPPFGFVTAGTTHLVLGPAEARWPLLSLADVPPPENDTSPAEAEATGTTSAAPESVANIKRPSPEQRRRAWWTAGMGAGLLLVWLTLWFMWTPQANAPSPTTTPAQVEQLLASLPDRGSVRVESEADGLLVTGYVNSDLAVREIATVLRERAPDATVRIWSNARLLASAREVVQRAGLDLELSAPAPGVLHATGTAPSNETWDNLRARLLADVAGLKRVEGDVAVMPAPASGPPAADIPIPPAAADPHQLTLVALRGSAGKAGWLRLSNGAVLFPGAQLQGFGQLVAVDASGATFARESQHLRVAPGARLGDALPAPAPALDASASIAAGPAVAELSLPKTGEKTAGSPQVD